jgi:hypothetical protein
VIRWRDAVVTAVGRQWPGAVELDVTTSGGEACRALAYPALTGRPEPGDRVLLNTTAQSLGLGTGGYAFVVAIPDRLPPDGPPGAGHVVKARYTPLQATVLGADEQDSPHHDVLAGADDLGVKGITLLPGEPRHPFGISHRLVIPSDYSGALFGIRPSFVSSTTLRVLGAAPRGYVPGELPRTFDGAELDFTTINGNGYDRPGSSLTVNVALWPRAFAVVANKDVLARLDPTQRAVLRRAGSAALEPALARLTNDAKDDAEILCRRGRMAFVEADRGQLEELRAAVQPVYDRLERSARTLRVIRAIERMKDGVTVEPAPRCAGKSASSVRGHTPIDGVYEVTTTEADLRAAGTPARDVIPENYGKWIYVFDRSRFAFTQEDKEACTWGYGTFRVNGQQMAWSFLDGGERFGPNNAYNRPGEFFRFGWSRYRDTLTLTPVKGAISPENFRAKPWHLVSTEPSERYLSKRCPPPEEAFR